MLSAGQELHKSFKGARSLSLRRDVVDVNTRGKGSRRNHATNRFKYVCGSFTPVIVFVEGCRKDAVRVP